MFDSWSEVYTVYVKYLLTMTLSTEVDTNESLAWCR